MDLLFLFILLFVIAILIFILGAGFGLRYLAYSIRGVGMSWGNILGMCLVASLGIGIGLFLLFLSAQHIFH